MFDGELAGIFIAPKRGGELHGVAEVRAIAGQGLEGDRYFRQDGTWTHQGDVGGADRQVTLIEAEALDALAQDYQLSLQPQDTRRNLLTRGVPLNHLVGREFSVGEAVLLRGVELCEPCRYLESLTSSGVERALRHRGGLRAEILTSGTLRIGAPIRLAGTAA